MKYIVVMLLSLVISLEAENIAVVKTVQGDVYSKNKKAITRLTEGALLDSNVTIITKNNSLVTIIFKDASILNLGENSLINLNKFIFKPERKEYDFKLFFKKGSLVFESGRIGDLSPESFELKTPQGMVAIRGTKFAVKVE